jgi:predicted transcriptional regulator
MLDTPENVARFRKLLPRGSQRKIARQLGITEAAVSQALKTLNPAHEAVQVAVRIAKKNQMGATAETEKLLHELLNEPESSTETVTSAA